MHYYKQIDANGETICVLSCDTTLLESDTQVEISEQEFNAFIDGMQGQEEEQEVDSFVLTSGEIESAYYQGVQEA